MKITIKGTPICDRLKIPIWELLKPDGVKQMWSIACYVLGFRLFLENLLSILKNDNSSKMLIKSLTATCLFVVGIIITRGA